MEAIPLCYIVEHFEKEVSDWTLAEYVHMMLVLSNLYRTRQSNQASQLILTNFPFVAKFAQGALEEDDCNSVENTQKLINIRKNMPPNTCRWLVSELSFEQLTSGELPKFSGGDDTQEIAQLLRTHIQPSLGNICFMDMRAEQVLQPQDSNLFKFVVFGGILGDHPPQDRACDFRARFQHVRQLGRDQMTTDTALLVSHEILEGQQALESLTFVDEPEIPTDSSVHRYLDLQLPLKQMSMESNPINFSGVDANLKDFTDCMQASATEQQTIEQTEATVMEGFRYRVDDTPFPIFKGKEQLNRGTFPIIPIGMLDVWREIEDSTNEGVQLMQFLN